MPRLPNARATPMTLHRCTALIKLLLVSPMAEHRPSFSSLDRPYMTNYSYPAGPKTTITVYVVSHRVTEHVDISDACFNVSILGDPRHAA